jgi:hypothetical protein
VETPLGRMTEAHWRELNGAQAPPWERMTAQPQQASAPQLLPDHMPGQQQHVSAEDAALIGMGIYLALRCLVQLLVLIGEGIELGAVIVVAAWKQRK